MTTHGALRLIRGEKLGSGTFSKVYKATSDGHDQYAVKVNLREDILDFMFSLKELEMNLQLKHPHIVPLCWVTDSNPFGDNELVSPLDESHDGLLPDSIHFVYPLAKCDLFHHVMYPYYRPVSVAELDKIMIHSLLAFEYIHSKGIVHRDVKIDNILIFDTEEGHSYKVSDFGFAKHFIRNHPLSPCSTTPYSRAPECSFLNPYCSYESDIWSAGCIYYELITGEFPLDPIPDKLTVRDTNRLILESMSRKLPWVDKDKIMRDYPEAQLGTGLMISDFVKLSREKMNEFGSRLRQFYELVGGIFHFDCKSRLTASQCLDLPYFDKHRDMISKIRTEALLADSTNISPPESRYPQTLSDSHKVISQIQHYYYSIREKLGWLTYRILFCCITLFTDLSSELSESQLDLPKLRLYTLSVMYIYLKYFLSSTDKQKRISFSSLDPTWSLTNEQINEARLFEIRVVKKLNYRLHRITMYDKLCMIEVPTAKDIYGMLVFWYSGHYRGLTVTEAFDKWNRNRSHYSK